MHRTQFDHTFGPSITHNLIPPVLTICHMKLAGIAALEQKCFELQSLSLHSVTFGYYLFIILFLFPCTVVGTFTNQNTQEVLVDLGQEISINCPQHSPSYGVSYSWQGKINNVDIQFKRNDRRAISQTGQLLIMYVTEQDLVDFAEYDSQGIKCFLTGANRFESSGLLKLKKKNAGKFFFFF